MRTRHVHHTGGAQSRPRPRVAVAVLCTVTVLAASGLGATLLGAAEVPVSIVVDGGAGSLRAAFVAASANAEADEIVLQPGETYVLDDCAEGDLDHTAADELTITGVGATIRQTCPGERVIESDGALTITDLTIEGGDLGAGIGGGIEADTSTVSLLRSTVTGNEAPTGGGIGALRVTLEDSTVSGNTAGSTGGGIWADQTLLATNSTITGNTAGSSGGGAAVVNTSITLLHATVVGNTSPVGANLEVQAGGDELVSFASVVALPQGGQDCALAGGVATTSQGANHSSDASCGFGGAAQDVSDGGDPLLGALGDNGGATATMLPAAGSPLIDGADCDAAPSAVVGDQRSVTRPQGAACDVGAVEVEEPAGLPDVDNGDPAPTAPASPPAAPAAAPAGLSFTG